MLLDYNFAVNKSMTRIFIAALSVAVGLWSVLIIRSRLLPVAIGYLGVALILGELITTLVNTPLTNPQGFTVFVIGLTTWLVMSGSWMLRKP